MITQREDRARMREILAVKPVFAFRETHLAPRKYQGRR
jgi:hypothetical protein